jgi:proline dehydrogenase
MKLPFFLARRFVAAESLSETIPVIEGLSRDGLRITLDMLGEYVSDRAVAERATDAYIQILETLDEERRDGMDAGISVKPSMLGLKIDTGLCRENLNRLLTAAREKDMFVRMDMEGSDLTESTLSVFESIHPEFPDTVGIVLQAYLHRTIDDVQRMCDLGASVRLCKGAYKEPASIAFQNMKTIREKYVEEMDVLLSKGRKPAIATHDDILIAAAKRYVEGHQIPPTAYEFQMLFGVRPTTQTAIANEGYRMRVYVPFGTQWLPYFSRRLRERKENVWFVVRNMFRR